MKRTPFKKKKKKSERDVLIKEVDTLLSLWIRQSNQRKDIEGLTTCSTCGSSYFWRQLHNGHYQSRRFSSTRFSEKNCAPQCARCNCFGANELTATPGESQAMAVWLDRKWGEGTAGMMKRESRKHCQHSVVSLKVMKSELLEKLENAGYETR